MDSHTCVCCGMFRKLLSRDPMPTNLLGAVAPGVEYATETEEKQRKTSGHRKTMTTTTSCTVLKEQLDTLGKIQV